MWFVVCIGRVKEYVGTTQGEKVQKKTESRKYFFNTFTHQMQARDLFLFT